MTYMQHKQILDELAKYLDCDAFTSAEDDEGNKYLRADKVIDFLDYVKAPFMWKIND